MRELPGARPTRSRRGVVLLPLLLAGVACIGRAGDGAGGSSGSTGSGSAGAAGSGQAAAGSSGSNPGTAGASTGASGTSGGVAGNAGGATGATAGTGAASGGNTGAAGGSTGVAGVGPATGTGGGTAATRDHCVYGYDPEPSDETMKDGAAEFYPPGNMSPDIVDLTVQPEVLKWMKDHYWQAAHVEWHAIRTCNLPGGAVASKVNICSFANLVPENQNCKTDGDGYQFLLFHRHMLQALKQLWPKHTEQFTGFTKFPTTADDVPPQWRSAWKPWDAETLAAGGSATTSPIPTIWPGSPTRACSASGCSATSVRS